MSFVWKVFGAAASVIVVTAVVVDLAVVPRVRAGLTSEIEQRVRATVPMLASLVAASMDDGVLEIDELERMASELPHKRFTVVAPDGTVWFDSFEDASGMDNHGQRPEILEPGTFVTRYSNTVRADMTYYALPVKRGDELLAHARAALPQSDIRGRITELRNSIRMGLLVAVGIALLAAFIAARRVTRPLTDLASALAEGGPDGVVRRLSEGRADEIGQLAAAVNRMAAELQKRVDQLDRDRLETAAILSGMSEGLVAVDKEHRVVLINANARRLLSIADGELRGRPVWEVTRVTEITRAVETCLASGSTVSQEVQLEADDGSRVLRFAAAPFQRDDDEAGGCVLVIQDLTELRRLEEVRRDFVANVSHELKTPLTAMHGYVEVVLDEPDMPVEQRRGFLRKALEGSERLSAILRDLFSLARVEAEDGSLSRDPLDLREVVSAVVQQTRSAAEVKGMTIELELPDEPVRVVGDGEALATAVTNLIDNAIVYSPSGTSVTVSCRHGERGVAVEVRDQGPGIPRAERARIFERFYRVDKVRSRELGGTGLGLSIVRNVVAAHGGEVNVESELGKGSLFRIVLPG